MGTYYNCYDILAEVRQGLNEYSTALLQASSTSGAYLNNYLVKKINASQGFLYALLFRVKPELFLTAPTNITVTSSVITKPSDFYKLYELRDQNGNKVYRSDARDLPVAGGTGLSNLYYEQGNYFRLNKEGVSETYKITYYTKPRELTQGSAPSNNTLATSAKAIADYYNGIILEDITGDAVMTITDYTDGRVITASKTLAKDSFYGTVSELPESLHQFIAPKAVQLINIEFPIAQGSPSGASLLSVELNDLDNRILNEIIALTGDVDVDIDDIFSDYGGNGSFMGYKVPGQGYLFR